MVCEVGTCVLEKAVRWIRTRYLLVSLPTADRQKRKTDCVHCCAVRLSGECGGRPAGRAVPQGILLTAGLWEEAAERVGNGD